MTAQLQKSMMEGYRARWQMVAEFDVEEQRQTSYAERWRKLNALLRTAAALGLHLDNGDEKVEEVRERWNRLRDRYSASLSDFQPMQ